MSKIIHYRDKCIGCGLCHEQLPQLWRMSNKDGKATLVNASQKRHVYVLLLNEIYRHSLQQIIDGCPVKVIKIEP